MIGHVYTVQIVYAGQSPGARLYRLCTLELSWSRNNCTVSHYIHSTCVHSAPHEAAPLTTSRSTRGVCTEPPHVVIAMLSDQPAVVDDF